MSTERMTLPHAVAIGVGGMIGAGVFSMMGVAGDIAGGATFLSFALAGVLALLCAYSFGKLGARYPSAGGPVEYLVKAFGDNAFSGGLNVTLWLGYVLALALYARAFAAYAVTFTPDSLDAVLQPLIILAVTGGFLLLNVAGAAAVGRVELLIVAIKLVILLGFIAVALPSIDTQRVLPAAWPPLTDIGFAAAVVFLSYEGFGLITNTAEDLAQPERELPRALSISVLVTIGIYVLTAIGVLGALSPDQVANAKEYALAAAVQPLLGDVGFSVMAIAALFSTASAINATLYGGANVSFMIAQRGALPAFFERRLWQRANGGLVFTAGLMAGIALLFELEGIAIMGSAAFLIVYGAVSAGHLRLLHETGARRWPVVAAVLGCILVFALLIVYMANQRPNAIWGLLALLGAGFGIDVFWRWRTGRRTECRST
jgi:amino acid transporter